jgi:hypothetical protein
MTTSGLGWGEATGGAKSSAVNYMKFKTGDHQIRIVSGVLARYDYWIPNKEGKSVPFENLSFDRFEERFIKGSEDPVSELGLMEKDPETKGKMRRMRSKRGYKCMVINRATGKLEAMDLKKSIFDGILATMQDLEVNDPTQIDFVIRRTGEQWYEVKYEINQIKTMKLQPQAAELHANDHELIESQKPLDELFPRVSANEQRAALSAWMNGTPAKDKDEAEAKQDSSTSEAVSELDD